MYVDAHCHFDMCKNPMKIIKACERSRIVTLGMTNLPSHFEMGIPHISNFKYIRLALGLHPLLALKHEAELSRFTRNINRTSYIGEVGLDFSKEGYSTKDIQLKTFEFVLKSIKNKNKIVSVHSRRAEREVLDLLLKYNIKNVIFHWYSGNITVLKEIISRGYYFSINPAMIESKSGQKIIAEIPLERILTETDCPYTKIKGRGTKPQDVDIVINYLSSYYSYSEDVVKKNIYINFKKLILSIK